MPKKSEYLPNFIVRGNKIIFTDELSQKTTKKQNNMYPDRENFNCFDDRKF